MADTREGAATSHRRSLYLRGRLTNGVALRDSVLGPTNNSRTLRTCDFLLLLLSLFFAFFVHFSFALLSLRLLLVFSIWSVMISSWRQAMPSVDGRHFASSISPS
jgi:hypothetical protein